MRNIKRVHIVAGVDFCPPFLAQDEGHARPTAQAKREFETAAAERYDVAQIWYRDEISHDGCAILRIEDVLENDRIIANVEIFRRTQQGRPVAI